MEFGFYSWGEGASGSEGGGWDHSAVNCLAVTPTTMTCVDARQGDQTLLHFYGLTYGIGILKGSNKKLGNHHPNV